jgi:hypothetical protein
MKLRFLAILLLAFLNCRTSQARDTAEPPPQDVTYCQFAKNPSLFSGKRIRIRAVYRYAFEIQRLEPPECCPDSLNTSRIWVVINASIKGDSLKHFHEFPKGTGIVLATFVGTLESGGAYGTFADKYELNVDQIQKVEHTARSSRRQDDPAWIPKNCGAPTAGG